MTTSLPKAVSVKIPTLYLTQLVSKIVRQLPKQTSIDLLKGIHFEITSDSITATSYNGVMATRITKDLESPLKLERPLTMVLMHPSIGRVFNQLSGSMTTFKYDQVKKTVQLTSDKSKYKLAAVDADDFPNVEDIITRVPRTGTLTAEFLKQSYSQLPKFTSASESRPVLQGVQHSIKADGSIVLTSTDSFSLRTKRIPFYSEVEEDSAAVVPVAILTELSNLLNKIEEEKVYLHTSAKGIAFHWEDQENHLSFQLYSSLIDGNYPDTTKLVERDDASPRVRFVRASLEQAIKRVLVGTAGQDSNNQIHFGVKGRQARVFTKGEFPAIEDLITESPYDGEIVFTFNPQFLLKNLQSFRSDEVLLTFTSNLRPVFVEDSGMTDGLSLLLPIRTTENVTVEWPEITEPLDFTPAAPTEVTPPEKQAVTCFVDTKSSPGQHFVTYQEVDSDEEPWGGYNIDPTDEALKQLNASICDSENVEIADTQYD